MSRLKEFFSLLKETFEDWNKDRAPRLAAALAYYTTFSIAPFLIVVIAIAGLVAGREAVQGQLDEQIQGLVGRQAADMIQELIQNTSKPSENILAAIVGAVALLIGAGGVFGQLQDALNTVWGVQVKPGGGIARAIKSRFLSFSMVLGVGFLLLVSLVLSSFIAYVHQFFLGLSPGTGVFLQLLDLVISLGSIAFLFALIYKILPDAKIHWSDVRGGAILASILFLVGKNVLGIYLGNSGVLSTYGAAGSLIIILLWIFYSAQILLFGAEFTQVYARRHGSLIVPTSNATAVTPESRAQAGLLPADKITQLNARSKTERVWRPPPTRPPANRLHLSGRRGASTVVILDPSRRKTGLVMLGVTLVTGVSAFVFGRVLGMRRDDA